VVLGTPCSDIGKKSSSFKGNVHFAFLSGRDAAIAITRDSFGVFTPQGDRFHWLWLSLCTGCFCSCWFCIVFV